MQYNVTTPAEYLAVLANDWRKDKLLAVRDLIQQHAPTLREGIKYKMLSYEYEDQAVFNLNAQRNYVSLYVGNIDKVADAREKLAAFDLGKGCIRIRKSGDLSTSQLADFIREVVAMWQEGGETTC